MVERKAIKKVGLKDLDSKLHEHIMATDKRFEDIEEEIYDLTRDLERFVKRIEEVNSKVMFQREKLLSHIKMHTLPQSLKQSPILSYSPTPANHGKIWSGEEEDKLKELFLRFCENASPRHERTALALFKRIEKLIFERRFNHEISRREGWDR